MSKFSVPSQGIQLQHSVSDSKVNPQIIRLDLPPKDLDALIKVVKDGGVSRLKTGRAPEVILGPKHVQLRHVIADKSPQELFTGPLDGSGAVYFAGKLSHNLELRQAKEAVAGVDEALELLKQNLKQANDERGQPDINPLTNKLLKPQHRPSPLSGLGSRPSSPFLAAGFSGPTSAPLLPLQSREDKIRLAAIKIPIIHLLAIEPQDPKRLIQTLRVKKSDFDQVISKVAQESQGGKKKLKDKAYRDLDVWKFPYRDQQERQLAIDHAISAFDRQRVDTSDNLWQMLLAKEDRNKGIKLSRLNFDKPLLTGNLTPRIPERSTDGGSTEGRSTKSAVSDAAVKKGKAPIVKKTDPPTKAKSVIVANTKATKESAKTTQTSKALTKPKDNSGSSKTEVKYKSSAKVENSDEEAHSGPSISITNTKATRLPDVKNNKFTKSTAISKPSAQQKQTSASSNISSDIDRGRLTPKPAMVTTRGGKETNNNASKLSASASKTLPPSQSGNSTRPRHGSSPVKPSPLGSSPPNNARDNDSTSTSSKGTGLSSAPSTPPTGSETSQVNKKRPQIPIKTDKKVAPLTNGVKRKADDHVGGPSVKRQQLTNGKMDSPRTNGSSKAAGQAVAITSKRATPDSDSTSDTEPLSRDKVIADSKTFHKNYAVYQALHEKLNATPENERKDADIDKVWKMHERLASMKEQIWREWGEVEDADKV